MEFWRSYGSSMFTNWKEVFSMAIAVAPVTNWRFYDTYILKDL